jgi:hypothetical protein
MSRQDLMSIKLYRKATGPEVMWDRDARQRGSVRYLLRRLAGTLCSLPNCLQWQTVDVQHCYVKPGAAPVLPRPEDMVKMALASGSEHKC